MKHLNHLCASYLHVFFENHHNTANYCILVKKERFYLSVTNSFVMLSIEILFFW